MPDINTLLDQHVVLAYDMVDRIFLNGYVQKLQEPDQLQWFLGQHQGEAIPRYEILGQLTRHFVADIDKMAAADRIPMVEFKKGERKEDIAWRYQSELLARGQEGVAMIGVAQEKANCFRPPAKSQRVVGKFAAGRNSAFVKHFYVYVVDREWGPAFIKFCTYAPFSVRVCLNGHKWLIQRLRLRGHLVEELDNGIAWVDDPAALERLARRFSQAHIQRFFDRWLHRLPNPFTAADRRAGYTYQLSILQLEVSRTEVFNRPLHGRQFFEQVILQQVDLGRPEKIQVIFNRRQTRHRGQQPARVRIFTQEVDPSLQVSHRHTRVKQYWKCDRALRTETTFNDTYDFKIGRSLKNLPLLIERGRDINYRLLWMERQSQRCTPAASVFEHLVMPTGEPGRRAPGLRFGDPRTVALFGALSQFNLNVFGGFYAKQLRPVVEHHLARPYSMTQMAYDLARLTKKGLLERMPRTNRYRLTALGRKLTLFTTQIHNRLFCGGLAQLHPGSSDTELSHAWHNLDLRLEALVQNARLAA